MVEMTKLVKKSCQLIKSFPLNNSCKYEKFIQNVENDLSLEYILIEGVNDDLTQAELLVAHAKRLRAKINLIPYNRVDGLEWKRPPWKKLGISSKGGTGKACQSYLTHGKRP